VECARAMFPNQKMIVVINAVIATINAVLHHLRMATGSIEQLNYTTWYQIQVPDLVMEDHFFPFLLEITFEWNFY